MAYYTQEFEGKEFTSYRNTVFQIDKNKFRIRDFAQPDLGRAAHDTIFELKRRQDKLYFGGWKNDFLELSMVNGDSMVLIDPDSTGNIRFVFKQLPPIKSEVDWQPIGKTFRFNGDQETAFAEFLNDSIMMEYGISHNDITVNEWSIENFNDHKFLMINYPSGAVPLHIDSVGIDTTYLTTYGPKKLTYTFQNYEGELMSNKLLGTWEITDLTINDRIIERPPEPPGFEFEKFRISKDTIETLVTNESFKMKWDLSATKKVIYFPRKASKNWVIWKILKLTNDQMVLEMSAPHYKTRPTRIYKRKMTADNNVSHKKPIH